MIDWKKARKDTKDEKIEMNNATAPAPTMALFSWVEAGGGCAITDTPSGISEHQGLTI